MEKVYVGKIISTHGIKGELKIISNFPFKDRAFKIGNKLIIDEKEYEIKSYRIHKKYDMITLDNYQNINEVLFLLKKKVYFEKEKLHLGKNEVLDDELLTYEVLTDDGKKGKVLEIFFASKTNKVMRIMLDKEILIPIQSPMIKEIKKEEKQIIIHLIKGMD